MPNIKIDNIEVSEESLRKVIKKHPELVEIKKERPLGDDFSMLWYLRELNYDFHTHSQYHIPKIEKRLNALIKIWEWKEKNDGKFGYYEVFDINMKKWHLLYNRQSNKMNIGEFYYYVENTELPYFSSAEIAKEALKELEAEYKIVFNVA